MIKTITSIALAGLVAATITGCGGAAPTPEASCVVDGVNVPESKSWVCMPMVEGAYAGVGIAPKSKAGMGFQRTEALANGRDDLARQIKVQVKNKVEQFTRSTGTGDSETVDKVTTAVSKQVAKIDLSGSKQTAFWQNPKTGELYLLVTVPESTVNGTVKAAVKTSYKNDQALWQQFQSKQAMDGLEAEFPTN